MCIYGGFIRKENTAPWDKISSSIAWVSEYFCRDIGYLCLFSFQGLPIRLISLLKRFPIKDKKITQFTIHLVFLSPKAARNDIVVIKK